MPADFWGVQKHLTEWRSGFNRYRLTWAGPELTTEMGASWRRAEAAKRDIPSHDFSFSFFQRMSGNVRIAYASRQPTIYTGSHEERVAKAASRVVHHMYAAIFLSSAWSTNGPWDRQCGGYTKKFRGRNM